MPALPTCETGRMSRARGISWSRIEVENLLAKWGEEKSQAALKLNHWNLDYYESLAREMGVRGLNRTAVECRNKAKVMMDYRRVVETNSRSGAGPSQTSCPLLRGAG